MRAYRAQPMRHRVDWQLGSLQPCVRPCWGAWPGHGVPGGLVWPLGTAVSLQCGALSLQMPVVPLCQASSNQQVCGLHKVFPCYTLICCTPEPHFFLRISSALTSPWHSSAFLLFGGCENHRVIEQLGLEDT